MLTDAYCGCLTMLALDRAEEKLAVSHIFIQSAGLSQKQIDDVNLLDVPGKPQVLWRRALARMPGRRIRPPSAADRGTVDQDRT
ncbi:MAG: hypothetical protein Q8Q26_04955 [Pseudorhodobacter sp.]|nr:hypothetical protein [Pseudorhodobacter sp.]